MHDLLLERQDHLQLPDLLRYAGELGLDVAAFESDLSSGRFASRVARDASSADEAGATGTPTFYINGRRYVEPYDTASLELALDSAQKEAASRHGTGGRDVGAPAHVTVGE